MRESLEMHVRRDGERVSLLAPEVGHFTCALDEGALLSAGARAGVLVALGRAFDLVVPAGVAGTVASAAPERVHAPVGFGDVLYEIAPLVAGSTAAGAKRSRASDATGGPLVLPSPQSGRFYHRPAPGEPAFADVGATIADGQPIGLIEVMKTFTHVLYRASATLPARAKLVRFVAADGGDVRQGDPLIEVATEGS
jgi:biotin carboxyl carrier protein